LSVLAFTALFSFTVIGASASSVKVTMPMGAAFGLNFSPRSIVVVVGVNNTIVWMNQDGVDHTATSNSGDPASFDTGLALSRPT
jgi:plastocyanin